jgi:hypothetical protein
MFNIGSVTCVYQYVIKRGVPQVVSERLFALTGCGNPEDNECPMEVTLSVLADYANVSREGKLNILGVFSEINPPVLPFRLPQMYLVFSIEIAPTEAISELPTRILLWDEDGEERLSLEQTLPLPPSERAGERSVNHIVGLAGVRFDRPGDYAFHILIAGEERRSIKLRVNEPRAGGEQG